MKAFRNTDLSEGTIIPIGESANGRREAKSNAAGLDVAKHASGPSQKQNPVSSRIGFIPFELVVGDFDFRSAIDMRPPPWLIGPIVRYDGVSPAVPDVNFIRPIGIGLAAT